MSKSFRQGREFVHVLEDVSLSVDPGEVVALEGPSGSGKTTLLSILGCILTPSKGRVVIDGHEVLASDGSKLAEVRKRFIGFVFQQYNLFAALSALENVELALNIKGVRGPRARQAAQKALEDVGLGDRMGFLPRDLSGGQKQRVAIARALVGSPSVLLADEPTANVDSRAGQAILEIFRTLAKRDARALLIVTHDPQVRTVTDRVLCIRDGRLTSESGT
ncbi:MAG TPA: ABC transporter ATP-binding protein [Polyangiaceae bacterium]|nr:ABC transporter ATP-binding protein [Polyangiaceae bacterium]